MYTSSNSIVILTAVSSLPDLRADYKWFHFLNMQPRLADTRPYTPTPVYST